MVGATWVLLAALMLFATSLLMHGFIDGRWAFARLPITWFYASWLIGLLLLAMPLFRYFEAFSAETAGYLLAVLAAFSAGSVIAAFWARRSSRPARQTGASGVPTPGADVSSTLLVTLLVLGVVGTSLLMVNTVLGGNLSLSDRLDSANFAAVRSQTMSSEISAIGPLFGPATLMSSIGSLGVAFVFYLRGARAAGSAARSKWLRRLALFVLVINMLVGFVGFGSRMFAIFGVLVAFFAFMEGRWSIGERLIAKRLTFKGFFVILLSAIVTLVALWVAATIFLEKRVQRQDPQTLLYRTHRASFSPLVYDLTRNDRPTQYFMLSLSYLTTPIPTLTFYLDLPESRQPGPFYGEYDFPAVWRWGRRLTFSGDPYSWEKARYDIFKPLGDIGFGTNVWSTLVRDLMADFGKSGALAFLAVLGFFVQRVFDLQRQAPSARRAGLLVYLRLLLVFAGLISMLFMTQIYWPLYLAAVLAILGGGKARRVASASSLVIKPASFRT